MHFDVNKEADKIESMAKERIDTKDTGNNSAADKLSAELNKEWGSLNKEQKNLVAGVIVDKYNNHDWDSLPIPSVEIDTKGNCLGINFKASALDFGSETKEIFVGKHDPVAATASTDSTSGPIQPPGRGDSSVPPSAAPPSNDMHYGDTQETGAKPGRAAGSESLAGGAAAMAGAALRYPNEVTQPVRVADKPLGQEAVHGLGRIGVSVGSGVQPAEKVESSDQSKPSGKAAIHGLGEAAVSAGIAAVSGGAGALAGKEALSGMAEAAAKAAAVKVKH
ncbi:hypothetical protein BH11CYA1_BH11CYA1_50600 [soil metagenome]